MSSVLIDTNILIDHLRGKSTSTQFLTSLIKDEKRLVCSIITRIELLAGIRPGEEEKMDSLLRLFREITVDAAVANAAGIYMNRFMKSHGLTTGDAIVAATAKTNGIPVYTLNTKHFPMKDIEIITPY